MSIKQKRTLMTIAGIVIGIVFLSIYFACVVGSVFYGDQGMIFGPLKMIKWMREFGFPKYLTLATFTIIVAICFNLLFFVSKSELVQDKLGRAFFQPKNRKTYGDAHFEEPEEYIDVAGIRSPEEALGTIVGQLDDSNKKLITAYTKKKIGNCHMAVFGMSGSGKSYTFTNNYILQAVRRRESLIISDPDGGLERLNRGYLLKKGYVVRTLNLKDLDQSDGWDCLRSLASDIPEVTDVKSQMFAYACIANTMEGGKQDIYFNGPLLLLRALVLRIYLGSEINGVPIKDEDRTIKTVYNQLSQSNEEEYLDRLFDETSMNEDEKRCLAPWRNFNNSSKNLKGNLIVNLGTLLQPLMTEKVADVLSRNEIDLELPGDVPCAYFCQFPDTHDTYKFIVSLFFSMLTQCLVDKADASPDGKLKVPVNFLLDEFPSLGVLPDWARKMAVVRKRNINIIMIFQNIKQLQARYMDDWVSILQNCNTIISLGVNDEFSAAFLQKRIGTTTIEVETHSHDGVEGPFSMKSKKYSTGEGKRDLLSLDEVFKINPDNSLVLFSNHNAIMAHKFPYIYHPDAKYLCPDPLGEKPSFRDIQGRIERREAEEALRKEYYQEHPNDCHLEEVARPLPPTNKDRVHSAVVSLPSKAKEVYKTIDSKFGNYQEIEIESLIQLSSKPFLSEKDLDIIYWDETFGDSNEEENLPPVKQYNSNKQNSSDKAEDLAEKESSDEVNDKDASAYTNTHTNSSSVQSTKPTRNNTHESNWSLEEQKQKAQTQASSPASTPPAKRSSR